MEFTKQQYIKDGTVRVNGEEIPYRATSENFPVRDAAGNVDASMFTFSYERTDVETTGRPVLFAWNGGPGCGSLFVHVGLLSPKKVRMGEGPELTQTAPFELMDNDACLLDTCDVVAVDAIGTGYARLYNQEAKATYCSTQKDAETFISCIRAWLTAHKRWNSPIYIMGESFGTIRNAVIAEAIFYSGACSASGGPMHLSGIIMLGSALDYGQEGFPIPKAVLNLPSIAAANWYWHSEGKGSLREFVEECDRFCYEEYVQALALGKRLSEEKQQEIARKLSYFTGYSVEKLLKDQLYVDIFQYPACGMAEEGKSIGIYDARFALDACKDPAKYDYFSDDASNAISMPAFTIGFNGLLKDELGIDIDEEYIEIWNEAETVWNFKTAKAPIQSLECAMHRNPKLRVMFGMGYYDMLTTMGWVHYLVSHYDLPEERVKLCYYESGHMPYLGDQQAFQLENDIKEFMKGDNM